MNHLRTNLGLLGMGLLTAALLTLEDAACAHAQESRPAISPPARLTPPSGLQRGREKSGDELVQMAMFADVARITPGEKFHLAFVFTIEPHWHIYWVNPGDSGGPTEIDITAPPGFEVGPTLFTRPQTLMTADGVNYGYEKTCVIFVEVTPPHAAPEQVVFSAAGFWMVCKDICKVGSGKAMLSLPFGKSSVPSASDDTVPQVVREHAKRLPRNIDAIEVAAMSYSDGRLTITVPSAGRDQAEFFPNPSPGVTFGDPKFEFEGQTLRMIVPVAVDPNNALGRPMHIAGVLGVGRDQGEPCYQFHIRLDRHGQPSRESQP